MGVIGNNASKKMKVNEQKGETLNGLSRTYLKLTLEWNEYQHQWVHYQWNMGGDYSL